MNARIRDLETSDWVGVALLLFGAVVCAAAIALIAFAGTVGVVVGICCLVLVVPQMAMIGRTLWRELR